MESIAASMTDGYGAFANEKGVMMPARVIYHTAIFGAKK
jgi:hypothetical protein